MGVASDHWKAQIFALWLTTVAKFEQWSCIEKSCMVGVFTSGTVLKGCSLRKAENQCSWSFWYLPRKEAVHPTLFHWPISFFLLQHMHPQHHPSHRLWVPQVFLPKLRALWNSALKSINQCFPERFTCCCLRENKADVELMLILTIYLNPNKSKWISFQREKSILVIHNKIKYCSLLVFAWWPLRLFPSSHSPVPAVQGLRWQYEQYQVSVYRLMALGVTPGQAQAVTHHIVDKWR